MVKPLKLLTDSQLLVLFHVFLSLDYDKSHIMVCDEALDELEGLIEAEMKERNLMER